jgi:hypothetical protein
MRDWWVYTLAMVFLGTYPVAGALLWIAGAAAFSYFREGDSPRSDPWCRDRIMVPVPPRHQRCCAYEPALW